MRTVGRMIEDVDANRFVFVHCQASLLQQQLCLESRARTEAQVRAQHLLQQNGELLQHLSMLIKHIQELELRTRSSSSTSELSQLLFLFLLPAST